MSRTRSVLLLAASLLLAAARPGQAQMAAAEAPSKSTLDGVYTAAQAAKGKAVFGDICSACHAPSQFSGLVKLWTGRTVFDLYEQIRTTMPYDGPGRLSREEYADVIAYLISLGGYPAGGNALGSEEAALKEVVIVGTK